MKKSLFVAAAAVVASSVLSLNNSPAVSAKQICTGTAARPSAKVAEFINFANENKDPEIAKKIEELAKKNLAGTTHCSDAEVAELIEEAKRIIKETLDSRPREITITVKVDGAIEQVSTHNVAPADIDEPIRALIEAKLKEAGVKHISTDFSENAVTLNFEKVPEKFTIITKVDGTVEQTSNYNILPDQLAEQIAALTEVKLKEENIKQGEVFFDGNTITLNFETVKADEENKDEVKLEDFEVVVEIEGEAPQVTKFDQISHEDFLKHFAAIIEAKLEEGTYNFDGQEFEGSNKVTLKFSKIAKEEKAEETTDTPAEIAEEIVAASEIQAPNTGFEVKNFAAQIAGLFSFLAAATFAFIRKK